MTNQQLNIVTISPEIVPFAKTGGLADVAGSLAKMYSQLNHHSIAILPAYQQIDLAKYNIRNTGIEFDLMVGHSTERVSVLSSNVIPGTTTYLLRHPFFSHRAELYGTAQGDYPDNAQRFILFSKAALELLVRLDFKADIIHCHDWQTGLVPTYLKNGYQHHPNLKETKAVFTIHNLAFQGLFPPETMLTAGLPWAIFHIDGLEFYGKMNFLKGGLAFSDHITTVSPTYAREILTPEFGCGLHGLLDVLSYKLTGIINGIDYSEWNPKIDTFLPGKYDALNSANKQASKKLLCKLFGLKYSAEKPLLGMVSRLASQKGLDLLLEILPSLFELDLEVVVLGTGDIGYHEMLIQKQQEFPNRLGLKLAFDNELAHLIYAGSDMFLMPSRYEPCGLGQLIALRYGAIPIVRSTGGLADTIIDFQQNSLLANGFIFKEYSPKAFLMVIERALRAYQNKAQWRELIAHSMSGDFSWEISAQRYLQLFNNLM